MGTLQAFYGRNIEKSVPGLYWITLLSDYLIQLHGLDLSPISSASITKVREYGSHLFQFYQDPSDWINQEPRMKLLSAPAGFFHKEDMINSIGSETNWDILDKKLETWR